MADSTAVTQVKALFATFKSGGQFSTLADPTVARNLTQSAAKFREEFDEASVGIENVAEQADKVAFRYTCSGVEKKSKKRAKWNGSGIARVRDGKIVAVHLNEDHWGRLIDLGVVSTVPQDDISGDWSGSLYGIPFGLDLTQAAGQTKVTGTLSIPSLGVSVPVSGTNNTAASPDVQLTGTTGGQAITFAGNWAGGNEIDGTLNGAGFSNQAVEINR